MRYGPEPHCGLLLGLLLGAAACADATGAPGEQVEFVYAWTGSTRESSGSARAPLPPGEYLVRGVVSLRGEEIFQSRGPDSGGAMSGWKVRWPAP